MRWLLGLLFAAVVSTASAQGEKAVLPDEFVSDNDREAFRVCRAAILVELGLPEEERTVLPVPVIEAMREQVEFIMTETIFNIPALSIEDGRGRIEFTERFVLDFAKTVGSEKETLKDPAKRGQILINCQPRLWFIMKVHINILMRWRQRAIGLDRGNYPYDTGPTADEQ